MVLKRIFQNLTSLFSKPLRVQVAALCYRHKNSEFEILLITSRGRGRWIVPKGWPMNDRTNGDAAMQEAYEEAGVRGDIKQKPIGTYSSEKLFSDGRTEPLIVELYPLLVTEQLDKFPEVGQRKLEWLPIADAIDKCDEPNLVKLLQRLDPQSL